MILPAPAPQNFAFSREVKALGCCFVCLLLWHRGCLLFAYEHSESAALTRKWLLDHCLIAQRLDELFHNASSAIREGAFASTQDNLYFHLVALFEEFQRLHFAQLQVVGANFERKANALYLNSFLFCSLFPFLFLQLIQVRAIIENFTNGRICLSRHFD